MTTSSEICAQEYTNVLGENRKVKQVFGTIIKYYDSEGAERSCRMWQFLLWMDKGKILNDHE